MNKGKSFGKTQGKLIVFEGISGTGKETQAVLLRDYLAKKGIHAQIVYHPTPEVKLLLSQWRKERNIDHVSEAYLLLADRYNRMQEVIKPALGRGEWVISLRNYVSALVYQAKTDSDRTYLKKEFARFEGEPDMLFYFDLQPEKAFERIQSRRKQTGEPLGKFEVIGELTDKYQKYHDVLAHIPHHVIDASGSIDVVHAQIIRYVH